MRQTTSTTVATLGLLVLFSLLLQGCSPDPTDFAFLKIEIEGSGTVSPGASFYPVGRSIYMHAKPSNGWKFDRWEGALSGANNPTSLMFTSGTTVRAIFISKDVHRDPYACNLTVTTQANHSVNFQLVGHSPEGYPLTYHSSSLPTKGNLTGTPPNITYFPNAGYSGLDTFEYKVSDFAKESAKAKVHFTVVGSATTGWARSFGSTGIDQVRALAIDADENVYLAGRFADIVDFDPGPKSNLRASAGGADVFLSKYTAQGDLEWTRTLGGTQDDVATGVAVDSQGNIVVVGTFSETMIVDVQSGTILTSNLGTGAFICKFKPTYELIWAREIAGTGDVLAHAVAIDSEDNIYVGGGFSQKVDFDWYDGKDERTSRGLLDAFVTRFTHDGKYGWTRVFGGTQNVEVTALATDNDRNVVVAGSFYGLVNLDLGYGTDSHQSKGLADVFLVKLDHVGHRLWRRVFGGLGDDHPTGLAIDAAGNVALCGNFQQRVNFNSTGSDYHTAIGGADGFVSYYNAAGQYLWTRTIGGPDDDTINAIAFDSSNHLYAVGGFTGTVNFHFPPGYDNKTSEGLMDAFVTKMSDTGTYIYTMIAGGTGRDIAYDIGVAGHNSHVFWTGAFQNTVNFDPRAHRTQEHASFGSDDCFIVKMNASGLW